MPDPELVLPPKAIRLFSSISAFFPLEHYFSPHFSPVNPRIGGNLGFFRRSGLGFYDQKREEKRRGLNRGNQPARGEKTRNQGEEAQCKRVVPSNQTRSEQSEPTIRKIR